MGLLPSEFDHFTVQTSTTPHVSIHGWKAGTGPPLLLIHGFPQTHLIWHSMTPELIKKFTVVLIDIRGYGASSKPKGTPSTHQEYAKSAMARDCATVMSHLGYDSYFVCGHDRGGRVAHKLAVDYPSQVRKLMVLDICPTLAMYGATDQEFATAYFHWFFLIQPAPWPEQMMVRDPKLAADKFIKGAKGKFAAEALEAYEGLFADEESCHGMCEDYRAAATIDLEEQRADLQADRKIMCPMRVLWGLKGVVEKKFNAIEEWKKVSKKDVTGEALDCGHYIPEEAPEETLRHCLEFFTD